jgi:DNA-binding CsgD family transcriptional regulator
MVMQSPFGAHAFSPAELKVQLEADQAGVPYLVLRDAEGGMRLVVLPQDADRLTIGRMDTCDVALTWDDRVSRVHAELGRTGVAWTIVDDGLSRNGTFVSGERLVGRRRLDDGDVIRVGRTSLLFRSARHAASATAPASSPMATLSLTEAQRRVLVALCRPFGEGAVGTTPATNQEICDELFLSMGAVKTHLRTLFDKLGVEDLPHNRKRARLVELAFQYGLVRREDFA